MEDVLDVYQRPYKKSRPVVCIDETTKEIHGDINEPIAPTAGTPLRQDYEYERRGTEAIFMIYEPLTGRCHAEARARKTALDYAHMIKFLCDEMYPKAKKIVLVQDNLNTHKLGSLYQAFPPEEARRLAERLELHFTPNHGSWLNMAEIALRVLSTQCLSKRFPSREELRGEITAWRDQNKRSPMKTDWQFRTKDARIKLKRLYPKISHQELSVTENPRH